jgi:hypothetical protein
VSHGSNKMNSKKHSVASGTTTTNNKVNSAHTSRS